MKLPFINEGSTRLMCFLKVFRRAAGAEGTDARLKYRHFAASGGTGGAANMHKKREPNLLRTFIVRYPHRMTHGVRGTE